jgi:hypothetical protein
MSGDSFAGSLFLIRPGYATNWATTVPERLKSDQWALSGLRAYESLTEKELSDLNGL